MSAVEEGSSPTAHSPPHNPTRPKGILKNSFQRSPPTSPTAVSNTTAIADHEEGTPLTEKELTIHNTHINMGHRRSSSAAGSRPAGSRRQSSRTPSHHDADAAELENSQRLKWDEANLYLTEQERTSTMKINEPKTPWAQNYDPAEDQSGDEDAEMKDIPGLSLGEPEEAVPETEVRQRSASKVHVKETGEGHDADEDSMVGMSAEEREKHRKFEKLRKSHYNMENVAHLLGHPEEIDRMAEEEDDEAVPPVPRVDGQTNGRAA